jgi:hypothetical protein
MRLLNPTRSECPRSQAFQVYSGPTEDFSEMRRRIGILVDAWLTSRDESGPDARATARIERKLHDAIKAGPFFGKVLSFAGLNLWVDDRTSAGLVELQESISL